MKKFLFSFLIIISSTAFGQSTYPFPTLNTTWYTDLQTPIPFGTAHFYGYHQTNGDTMMNGFTYTRISRDSTVASYCYIREANNKVYCKYNSEWQQDTSEFMLYNFDLQLGDTLSLPLTVGSLGFYPAEVYFVDSVLIASDYRKRIHLNSWIPIEFIAGIGSAQSLLYCEIPWVDWWADLHCFSINNTVYAIDGTGMTYNANCGQYVGVEEKEKSPIRFFPNPVSDKLTIEYSDFLFCRIINLSGQEILFSNSTVVDLSGIPKAIYILELTGRNERKNVFRKIVKM